MFEQIYNDLNLKKHYNEIEQFEDETQGSAYHNWKHVTNVTQTIEAILTHLNASEEYIESAKIASILHDTGAIHGKDGHAERGALFAEHYFKEKSLVPNFRTEILNAIKDHSNGFNSNELMTLALIISDKLDITKSRLANEGYNVVGIRQLQFINNIDVYFEDNLFIVDFKTDKDFNVDELNEFYFMNKVFNSIRVFSKKINRQDYIKLNGSLWDISIF